MYKFMVVYHGTQAGTQVKCYRELQPARDEIAEMLREWRSGMHGMPSKHRVTGGWYRDQTDWKCDTLGVWELAGDYEDDSKDYESIVVMAINGTWQ